MFNRKMLSLLVVCLVVLSMPAFARKSTEAQKQKADNIILRSMPTPSLPYMPDNSNPDISQEEQTNNESPNSGFPSAMPLPFMVMQGDDNSLGGRMNSFKKVLKINDDQMPYWDELVDAVKLNEKIRNEEVTKKNDDLKKENASNEAEKNIPMLMAGMKSLPEEIEDREKNMHQEYDGLQRLKPALLQLYNFLNGEQKQTLDRSISMYLGMMM